MVPLVQAKRVIQSVQVVPVDVHHVVGTPGGVSHPGQYPPRLVADFEDRRKVSWVANAERNSVRFENFRPDDCAIVPGLGDLKCWREIEMQKNVRAFVAVVLHNYFPDRVIE